MKDKKYYKARNYIDTDRPGQILGIDILEVTKNERVLMAIDYFSRKLFAKCIATKEAKKIVKFVEEVQKQINVEEIIADNGREFENDSLRKYYT